MCADVLQPPAAVKYMKKLDRKIFNKTIEVPCVRIQIKHLHEIRKELREYMLKMNKVKPIRRMLGSWTVEKENECQVNAETPPKKSKVRQYLQIAEDDRSEEFQNQGKNDNIAIHHNHDERIILLNPNEIHDWSDLPHEFLAKFQINEKDFYYTHINLNYNNWRADEIIEAILPVSKDSGFTSFSQIGHIIHVNLRPPILPYKKIIGEVLLEKIVNCRTVVNKISNIENVYRNLELELICGDDDYNVRTKEGGFLYEFDFSKVYWNPRLSTEHERIIKLMNNSDILYDVFAGVGPFVIPAAIRKNCQVLANDLNPDSYKWLQHNLERNKCLHLVQTFNKDGRAFIKEDVKTDLLKRWMKRESIEASTVQRATQGPKINGKNIHITMNLPTLAVEFLDAFCGLFSYESLHNLIDFDDDHFKYPFVHVYTFMKSLDAKEQYKSKEEVVRCLIERKMNTKFNKMDHIDIHFVRKVSPSKDMLCLTFQLNKNILITQNDQGNDNNLHDENATNNNRN